ncbi:MAG: transcriptional regulator [Kiritimatiellaeota bacterium]|nr:transcriptional regulator [Kiritimatiellota bacterium]
MLGSQWWYSRKRPLRGYRSRTGGRDWGPGPCRSRVASVLVLVLLCLCGASCWAGGLEVGAPAPRVALSGAAGGRLNGAPWSSSELRGRVHVLFYVDPDEKDLNEHVAQAIKREKFPDTEFGSVAVINMAATWKPNWLIAVILKRKQARYPRTVYVRDNKKVLVRKWGLADDSYVITVFDRDGRVRFSRAGKFTDRQTRQLIDLLREEIGRKPMAPRQAAAGN